MTSAPNLGVIIPPSISMIPLLHDQPVSLEGLFSPASCPAC